MLFVAGAIFAAHFFSQVHVRVEQWLNPWPTKANPLLTQLGDGGSAWATGGSGEPASACSTHPSDLPEITSDMIFAAIAIEMGMIGAAAVAFAYILLVGAGMRIAQTARSDFSRLMATGLTIIIGFQAFFIMAGVVRLLPLTGITLPFVAYGGSSLLANYILIALLMRISDEGAQKTRRTRLRASSSQASTPWCRG